MQMKYGYLRISSAYQSHDQQERELRQYGVRIFEKETVSGRKAHRPVLEALLEELRRGDELHVTKLDRLGRSGRELHEIAQALQERGITLVIGGKAHDPTDPMGKMFFGMLATFAEFEADLIAERTRERLAELRAQGKQVGKKRKFTERQEIAIFNAVQDGRTITEFADRYSVSRTTVRRAVQREALKRELKENPEARRELKMMKLDRKKIDADLDAADADAEGR